MPTQLSKGTTYTAGGSVTDVNLNALVDAGSILPGCISEQTQAAPAVAAMFLYRSNTGSLRKCSLTQVINAFPADDAAGTPSLRRLGTTSIKAAAGNDNRFPANVTGIRLGANAASNDTAATAKDFSYPLDMSGGTTIDWDVANVFYDTLAGNRTITAFSNLRIGRQIHVIIKLNGFTVTFTPVISGGIESLGAGTTFSHYVFTRISGALGTIAHVIKS